MLWNVLDPLDSVDYYLLLEMLCILLPLNGIDSNNNNNLSALANNVRCNFQYYAISANTHAIDYCINLFQYALEYDCQSVFWRRWQQTYEVVRTHRFLVYLN